MKKISLHKCVRYGERYDFGPRIKGPNRFISPSGPQNLSADQLGCSKSTDSALHAPETLQDGSIFYKFE